jgi:integrase
MEHIDKVREVVKQRYRDLIDLALLTGARPGELVGLTSEMINTRGEIWSARLTDHKNVHHAKQRTLFFGPKAQLILRRYIENTFPGRRLFPIKVNAFRDTIVEACDRLGIDMAMKFAS